MTILCYHNVTPDWDQTLSVPPDEFERHCAWLARHRRVLPLRDTVERLDRRWRPTGPVSAITFDDGWRGVHDHAWPALRRHGLPFTVFVVADTLADPDRVVDWVIDPPDRPLEILTVDQIRAMHDDGVEMASHSMRHADLTTLGYEECTRDLRESRVMLEDLLEARVRTLAYPSGRHDEVVRRAAEAAGYEAAFTLPERREDVGRFAIPRVGVYSGNTTRTLRVKTSARYLDARLHPAHEVVRRLRRLRTAR